MSLSTAQIWIVVGEHGRIEPPEADRAAMMSGGDARHVGDFPDHIYHVADAFFCHRLPLHR